MISSLALDPRLTRRDGLLHGPEQGIEAAVEIHAVDAVAFAGSWFPVCRQCGWAGTGCLTEGEALGTACEVETTLRDGLLRRAWLRVCLER